MALRLQPRRWAFAADWAAAGARQSLLKAAHVVADLLCEVLFYLRWMRRLAAEIARVAGRVVFYFIRRSSAASVGEDDEDKDEVYSPLHDN